MVQLLDRPTKWTHSLPEVPYERCSFAFDVLDCPQCGGRLRLLATITQRDVIERILTHLGLQARAPPRAPARGQALQAA